MQKVSWIVALEFFMILALCITTIKKHESYKATSLFWIIMVIGALFMMSETSALLWRTIPLMESIQFPWRLTIIFDLALAYFAALKMPITWKASAKELHIPLILACVLLSFSYNNIVNVSYALPPETKTEIDKGIATGKYLEVYLPKDSDLTLGQVMSDNTPINYKIVQDGIVLDNIPETGDINVHQFTFPSWQAVLRVDAKDTPLKIRSNNGKLVIENPNQDGQIFLTHRMMMEEKIGLTISLFTAFVMLMAAAHIRRKKPR